MSERYTRLFALEENLYSEGSPVVVSAGALLKDNQTGTVLAQLKIRNISSKTIKAAAVRVACFDTLGKPLEGAAEKEYLDLAAGRDEEFGQKSLIPLPDASARSFSVTVTWVAFSDNTVWNTSGEALSALPKPDPLGKVLGDEELVRQYRLKYGTAAKSFPRKHNDLWSCTCGALNRAEEEACHVCGQKLTALLSFDAEALKAEKDARLQKEAEEQAKAAAEKAAKAKINKKIAVIATSIICLCIAFVILLTQVIIPKQKFNKAMRLIDSGEYDSAYAMLSELGNTEAILENIYDRAMTAIDAGDYDSAYALLENIGNYEAIEANKYDRAMDAIDAGDFDSAYALLEELGKAEEIAANKYDRAMEAINAGDYDSAYALLEEIGNYEAIIENKYDRAMERIDARDYETAYMLLDGLEYKDSQERLEDVKPLHYKTVFAKADVGDTIVFGSYEQDNDKSNGKENIEWLVLAKKDDKLFVISLYALDRQRYNRHTWEDCTLRSWMNEDFFNAAFSDAEKNMISTVTVSADKNPDYDTNPGIATQDRIFALSILEANEYFRSDEARMCVPTAYAIAKGAYTSSKYSNDGTVTCKWWLRSPGDSWGDAAYVSNNGGIHSDGITVGYEKCCVRPAMWIDIEN